MFQVTAHLTLYIYICAELSGANFCIAHHMGEVSDLEGLKSKYLGYFFLSRGDGISCVYASLVIDRERDIDRDRNTDGNSRGGGNQRWRRNTDHNTDGQRM